MANRVLKETSKIRHLSIKSQVKTDVKTNAQIAKAMADQMQRNPNADGIKAVNLYLRQLGFAPKNYDMQKSYARMLGEQTAGYYDNRTKAFTTSSRVNPLELETIMSHELTHALQDQHFDLRTFKKAVAHNSDMLLARKSLIEGDATLVMRHYTSATLLRSFGVFAAGVSSLFEPRESKAIDDAPLGTSESMRFPYTAGLDFATELYKRGGWASITKAYTRPPLSTQQILHFDKYLSNRKPENVPVPDVLRVLGKGWKMLDHDVDGEFGLSLILSAYADPEDSKSVAEGWSGDHYAIYSGPKGAALIVQDSLWNDEDDADYWVAGYEVRTQERFGELAKERHEKGTTIWNAASDVVWVKRKGRRVVVLEGTAGAFDAKRVLKALLG